MKIPLKNKTWGRDKISEKYDKAASRHIRGVLVVLRPKKNSLE